MRKLFFLVSLLMISLAAIAGPDKASGKPGGPRRISGLYPNVGIPEGFVRQGNSDWYVCADGGKTYDIMAEVNNFLYGWTYSGIYTAIQVDDCAAKSVSWNTDDLEESYQQDLAYLQGDLENGYISQEEFDAAVEELSYNGSRGVYVQGLEFSVQDNQLLVQFVVTNHSSQSHLFSLGGYADIYFSGRSHQVRRVLNDGRTSGLEMILGDEEPEQISYQLLWEGANANPVSDFWFGQYNANSGWEGIAGDYHSCDEAGYPYEHYMEEMGNYDAGIGWCWKGQAIAPGETVRLSYIFAIGKTP